MKVMVSLIIAGLLVSGLCLSTGDQHSFDKSPKVHLASEVDTSGKGKNQYCTRNNECDSGCCNWEKVVPGYGTGMCDDPGECYWLQEDDFEVARKADTVQCPNQLDFGRPTKYKISVGNAAIRKRGNNLEVDRFGDGTVFYSAQKGSGIALWVVQDGKNKYVNDGLTFTENRRDAATFDVSLSQYGRRLTNKERALIKHPDNDNGLQLRKDFDNAAIVTFTRYVEPEWKEDTGPTRDKVMIELLNKVCGTNMTCVQTVAGYLQPEKLGQFSSCE